MTDWLTKSVSSASSPRAHSCAIRALVPVPHGERSSQPGWIEVAATASAPSRPGSWKTTWWQPLMRLSPGWTGRSAALIAAITARPASISSVLRDGSTASPAEAAGVIA